MLLSITYLAKGYSFSSSASIILFHGQTNDLETDERLLGSRFSQLTFFWARNSQKGEKDGEKNKLGELDMIVLFKFIAYIVVSIYNKSYMDIQSSI